MIYSRSASRYSRVAYNNGMLPMFHKVPAAVAIFQNSVFEYIRG
eukprot:SAG31_NODE_65_length_28565_cov_8.402914_30_plen_44_part_00